MCDTISFCIDTILHTSVMYVNVAKPMSTVIKWIETSASAYFRIIVGLKKICKYEAAYQKL